MRTLMLADIHGNLTALEAVLASPEAQRCDRIVSLGDHTNFGPESRPVHDRLRALGALILMGNHEDRLLRIDDPEFAGYNWALLRFTARQMAGAALDFPQEARIATALCTHAAPGELYHFFDPTDLPEALEALPEGVTHLISGHNHVSWDVTHAGRRAFNPGSCGMWKYSEGGHAPFAVLETDGDRIVSLTHHHAVYDMKKLIRAWIETGAAAAAPQMCRASLEIQSTGDHTAVYRMNQAVIAAAREMHLTFADEEAWRAADLTHAWKTPVPTAEFWRLMEETVC